MLDVLFRIHLSLLRNDFSTDFLEIIWKKWETVAFKVPCIILSLNLDNPSKDSLCDLS